MPTSDVVVSRTEKPDRWTASRAGEVAGTLVVVGRPDGRTHLMTQQCEADVRLCLLQSAAEELSEDLYVEVEENEDLHGLRLLGFSPHRREHVYAIDTDPASTGLGYVDVPAAFAVVPADQVAEDRLRLLDDALRQDVPGTDGWKWDAAGFRDETYGPQFDPASYLVAVDRATGADAGLIRVWDNPRGRRLGLIATKPEYRGRGLAKGLIARVFNDLHRRGISRGSTEADTTNTASNTLLKRIGARRVGGTVELLRATTHPR